MSNKKLIYEIKPKYSIGYTIISHFLDVVVFAFILILLGSQQGMLAKVILATFLVIFGIIIVMLLKLKRTKAYFYRFYEDEFVYCNSFFSKKVKTIKYPNMKEIRYKQSIIQSKFNIGDIYLITSERSFFKKVLIFNSIPNVEKHYEIIVKLLNT